MQSFKVGLVEHGSPLRCHGGIATQMTQTNATQRPAAGVYVNKNPCGASGKKEKRDAAGRTSPNWPPSRQSTKSISPSGPRAPIPHAICPTKGLKGLSTRTHARRRTGVLMPFKPNAIFRFEHPYGVFGCHEKWNVRKTVRLGS